VKERQAILAESRRDDVTDDPDGLGEGRFFILLGKAFAETMLELQGK
jgi:hypothetical protein